MKLTEATAAKYLGTLLTVVHAVDELVNDKLLPAELAIAGVKAALESLDESKIEHVSPDEIRGMKGRLINDLADLDAKKDAELKAKFDTSDAEPKS